MKKYIEAALEHLYTICEEKVPEKKAVPEMSTGIMSYEEFSKRYYKMFKGYEKKLIILNGPDFDMMKAIYQDWQNNFPNLNHSAYCSLLRNDLDKQIYAMKQALTV